MTGSWKTTLAGIAMLLSVLAKTLSTGQVDWAHDGAVVIAAIGLLTAKDHNAKE